MNPAIAPQIGYTPLESSYGSQIVMGRNPDNTWDAIGIGPSGQPGLLNGIVVNLADTSTPDIGVPAIMNINVADILSIMENTDSSEIPAQLNFTLKEVAICEVDDAGVATERRMVILGSQTYPAPTT